MIRIILSLLPLIAITSALVLFITALITGSSPLFAVIVFLSAMLYIASGAWKRFSVSRGVHGGS